MMKKSTWKKLFTRSKSKSSTRAAKKAKQTTTVSCNVCAGVDIINVDTLCPTHRHSHLTHQSAVSPQSVVSTGRNDPSPVQPSESPNKQTIEVKDSFPESAPAVIPMVKEELKVTESAVKRSAPVEIPKPQPLVRTSTNEEFMTEEVDSHNLSDNSRTEENPAPEAEECNDEKSTSPNELKVLSVAQELKIPSTVQELKVPSTAQELQAPSTTQELKVPSGAQVFKEPLETEDIRSQSETHGLRNRHSSTQMRELSSDQQESNADSESQKHSSAYPAQEPLSGEQDSPPNQHGLKTPHSSVHERDVGGATLNIKDDSEAEKSLPKSSEDESSKVEAKNRKNSLSHADNDLNSIIHGGSVQPQGESKSSGKQEETASSTNNEEFMSEEVASGGSVEGEEVYSPKSSQQVSSAVNIAKHDTSSSCHQGSNNSSNHGLEIVEVDEQGATLPGHRLSIDASNKNLPGSKPNSLGKGISVDSSEDLKPGMLQAQRSSKLNISFSEHVSLLGEAKTNDGGISYDSLESSESMTETTTIIETTAIIVTDEVDLTANPLKPSGAQDFKTSSGTESEEALLLPPPVDEDPTMEADSGMGSDESSHSGPKETAEDTSIRQNTANNPRTSPTIIFGTISGPDHESGWSQPLFFGPNSLAQGLTMNVGNRDHENAQAPGNQGPFPGFGIINIMRDLYENDSSSSQVDYKVTEVTEEKKKAEEAEESGQTPPTLDDEDQEQESLKGVPKKQE